MIRTLLINPILLALSAVVGLTCCHAAGFNPHPRELSWALIVFIIASQVALVPLLFQQRPTAMTLTQSALVGLVLHLIVSVALALLIMLLAKTNAAFAYWTLLFYWTTLSGLSLTYVRTVRSATTSQAHE